MFRRIPKFELDQPGADPYAIPPKQQRAGFGTILLIAAAVGAIGACFFTYFQARASVESRRATQAASPPPSITAVMDATISPTPSATPTAGPASSGDRISPTAPPIVQTVEVEVTRLGPTQIVNQSKTVYVDRDVPGPTQLVTVQVPVTQIVVITQVVIQTVVVIATPIPATATATASQTATPTPTFTSTATPTPSPTPTETPTP